MKLLWVVPYLPWPTTSGGKTRQYHLLRSLAAQGHRITLLVQSKTPLDEAARQALEPLLERLIVLPRRPLKSLRTLCAALCARWPLLTTVNGLSPALTQRFGELLQEGNWDVVQVEHSYAFEPLAEVLKRNGQPFVLTEHNLESSLGAATYDRFPGWAKPFVCYDQWRARRWERTVFDAATRILAVTEEDAAAMRRLTDTPVDVVVNGVDCRGFAGVRADISSQRILFVGNYEYAPNVDAVSWLLDDIAPRLWALAPQARLVIAGYALPRQWAERWPDTRIEWAGFVPDLPALQSQCAAFVAPLRHGGGSKLKVLEALAAGLPLVSTAQGVSGLGVVDQRDYLAGETADEQARALARVLGEPQTAASLGTHGRQYVLGAHDWGAVAQHLQSVYLSIRQEATCA